MKYLTPLQNLLNHSIKHPNNTFLHQPINGQWQQFTWQAIEQQARSIAAGLQASGYQAGDNIGILSKNCAHWVIADLAITMAGMISVPIYSTANRQTIRYIIEHAQLKAVFVGKLDDLSEAEAAIQAEILRIAFPYPTIKADVNFVDWLQDFPALVDIHLPDINDIATIVYTSGSTGNPKGVVLTHKNWVSAAQYTASLCDITSTDRAMCYLPLAHIVERSNIAIGLHVGYQLFFTESLDTFIADLQHAKPTIFGSVPRLWKIFQSQILLKLPQRKLNILLALPIIGKKVAKKIRSGLGLQYVEKFASGSAPISLSLLHWYEKIGINISEGWGMSESSSLSCINYPYSHNNLGTIGYALDCVEMKLSTEGEILIRGDAIFSGYYLDPETTKESFVDGWFRTGDCAELTASGAYNIIGRIKDKFKTAKGKYVAPVPIENLFSSNSDVNQVCLIGSGLAQPIAMVVLDDTLLNTPKSNRQAITTKLQDTLSAVNSKLESHQKVAHIIVCHEVWSIDNELLTPTMKIKRNVIEQKYDDLVNQTLHGEVIWQIDLVN
jgi:long-subunit acyl-CoA synthetase (AMP-forming)